MIYKREINKDNATAIKSWSGRIEVAYMPTNEDGDLYTEETTKKCALSFIERIDVCNCDSVLDFDHVSNYALLQETY